MIRRYLLRNVKQLNGETINITIEDGMITAIRKADKDFNESGTADLSQGIASSQTMEVFDGNGLFVSSGWIDLHVHAVSELKPYGDEIDEIGVKQGVATIVDAGSCGADRMANFQKAADKATTNVLAFLNISRIGLDRVDELSNLKWIDREKVVQTVKEYPALIVGLKARMSASVVRENGIEPLIMARELSKETDRSLMIHIGSAPPRIEQVLELLGNHDVVTHYLNGKANNLFDDQGQPLPEFLAALDRGIHLDVGHGSASFSFKVAEQAKRANIPLHTISSDIYRGNRLDGPVYSLAHVMSKFLYLGYSLQEVINTVTVNAAQWLNKPELGRIGVGDPAHLTLFEVNDGDFTFEDSEGAKRQGSQLIEPKGVFVHGSFIKC